MFPTSGSPLSRTPFLQFQQPCASPRTASTGTGRGEAPDSFSAEDPGERSFSDHCIVQWMLTVPSRADVMNRLGRAMADPTRSRILLQLLDGPKYPSTLASDLGLTRSNVSNHLSCLRGCGIVVAVPEGRSTRYEIADAHLTRAMTELVDVVLAVDDGAPCTDEDCEVPLCCGTGA